MGISFCKEFNYLRRAKDICHPNYKSHYRWRFYYGAEWGIVQPEVAWVMGQKIEFIETAFRHEYTGEDTFEGLEAMA